MTYAKTSKPSLPCVFNRKRLFDWIEQHCDRQAIWIQGQAGAGKTTLVTSYLEYHNSDLIWYQVDAGDDDPATFFHYFSHAVDNLLGVQHKQLPKLSPESLSNLEVFTRFYFRELFNKLPKPLILVFDNFQEISPNSQLNQIVAAALSEIPEEICTILISRNPPSPALSRMQLNRTLVLLGQDELRLTNEESLNLASLWLHGKIQIESVQYLNELVDGWVAGFVLMLEHGEYQEPASRIGREHLYSYFANEVFDALDAKQQQFLLHTACLTNLTASVTRAITGEAESETILEELCKYHYFTSKSDEASRVYQYHPLFREFLLNRGRNDLGNDACQHIAKKAAYILASDGQIEDAARLAQATADWQFLSKLICRQAPILLDQQRFELLEQWLQLLPDDELNASPWLNYWFGCCRLPFDQRESGSYFESAYSGFKAQQEHNGMLLAASGAVLAIITEWDDFRPLDEWITALDQMARDTTVYASGNTEAMVVLAMFGALLFRMPQHPDMAQWEAEAERLIRDDQADISLRIDIGNVLVHWKYWKGDLASASSVTDILSQLIECGDSAILPQLHSAMNQAIYGWHMAEFDACLESVSVGLSLAEKTGIHIMDDRLMAQGIYASLSRDDLSTAAKLLDRMKPVLQAGRRLSVSHYYHVSSNYHFIANDLEKAKQHGEVAVKLNREVGTPFPEGLACITLAQIVFDLGEREQAATLLADAAEIARTIRSKTLELLHQLTSAWFEFQLRHEDSALSYLQNGLALQQNMGFLNLPGWRSKMMMPLLLWALDNNIEETFVQKLIQQRGLHTDAPPQASENWPWPVKVYTLGRFSLLIDGNALQFSGKSQQKPLELLKVLIALGGRDVSKDHLIDALWPDTEGDKAKCALDTTLHRLRKLLGYEQAVQIQDRKLSLNSQLCWVDIWCAENLLSQIEILTNHTSKSCEQAMLLQQQLVSIHKGHFLNSDSEHSSIICYRERLLNRMFNRFKQLGRYLEEHAEWDRASILYQQMLEIDDRQEATYQRLMICYQNLGLIADAITIYERCRANLATYYGISPSAEMEALCENLS